MLALPPAPAPSRPRLLMIGTALVTGAVVMLVAGMIGVYLYWRGQDGGLTSAWIPKRVGIPEVPANTMLVTMLMASILVQWAAYAAVRGDRRNTALALGATVLFGAAVVNAQAYIYRRMGMPLISPDGKRYNTLFFTLSGTVLVLVALATVAVVVTAFRVLGGRLGPREGEVVNAVALFWHTCSACLAAVWYVLYVLK
jgi:heme/copper-type cytochrome/quinol oxidase subunit 3